MYDYCTQMAFFCIINHGVSKIHTYMWRCLLHLPQVKFLRTELLGSTVHMSRYLIHKVCQGDSIASAPTSTRASLALYFCSNNLCAVEHGVCTCRWGYMWRLSTPLFLSSDRVPHWSQSLLSLCVHLQMRYHDQLLAWRSEVWTHVLMLTKQVLYLRHPSNPKQLCNLH